MSDQPSRDLPPPGPPSGRRHIGASPRRHPSGHAWWIFDVSTQERFLAVRQGTEPGGFQWVEDVNGRRYRVLAPGRVEPVE